MNGRPIDTEIEHQRCRSSRTHAKATRRRQHVSAAVALDAGVFVAEPPRFVVVSPGDFPGFRLHEIAAGVWTLATEEVL